MVEQPGSVVEGLLAALEETDDEVREATFVARRPVTVLGLLASRLGGRTEDALLALLSESGRLGGEASPERALRPGDEAVLRYVAREPRVPVTWAVLHEDTHLLLIDKGPGFPIHPAGVFLHRTLVRALREAGYVDVRPAHRLDRETSGVVALARTDEALALIRRAWASGAVRKTYLAVTEPAPPWSEAEIDLALGPDPTPGSPRARQAAGVEGGKHAVTGVRVLRRSETAALVECAPRTGRLHQIRAHLAAVGCPIVGDKLYRQGGEPFRLLAEGRLTRERVRTLGHPRQALHARSLTVPHPSGVTVTAQAPLPPDLVDLLAALGLGEESAQPPREVTR